MTEHTCNQGGKFEEILGKISKQKELGEEAYALALDTSSELSLHREAQVSRDKSMSIFMENTQRIMDIVDTKLIPAYENEQKAIIAKAWIKEQAKSGKFWVSVLMSIVAFLGVLGYIARHSLK